MMEIYSYLTFVGVSIIVREKENKYDAEHHYPH